ncbi:MAG: DUF1116 domain-containing protein [Aigarchaeota archaeon]|nr:DUF1116 domain-containing protein [Candidatus Pelearchaeum maunauluense]
MVREEVEKANGEAVERMMESDPVWVGVGLARDKIPGMREYLLLHAGPPLEWERASGPMRGAVIGAIIYEGWATTQEEAEKLVKNGQVKLEPTHHHNAVGPMCGIISPSMPVYEIHDRRWGNKTYSNLNEGIGKVLRYGAYDKEVLDRLRWMSDVLYPVLEATIREVVSDRGGVALKPIIAQALQMGDDCHNRYVAATSLLLREITPYMMRCGVDTNMVREAYSFMNANNFTALNLGMAAAKAMTLAAHNIEHSTIVTVMSRNGTDTGIWVSGLGDKWFTAPAPIPRGVLFPGFSDADANPDLGDSAITETAGFGGFAMAAAPAIVSWVGGSVKLAIETTQKMYEITYTKHKYFQIPYLNFQGTPTGVDIRKVLKTGITPTINTGIAHKQAGVGQIGAGIVSLPIEMFRDALRSYAEKYKL